MIRRGQENEVQFGRRLTSVPTAVGLPDVDVLWDEISEYVDVLLGREEAPVSSPYLGLAECSTAYYMRGQEIDSLIHNGEREGWIAKGSPYYRFRTGELRSFLDLSKRAAELGSRRLTQERLLFDQREIEQ